MPPEVEALVGLLALLLLVVLGRAAGLFGLQGPVLVIREFAVDKERRTVTITGRRAGVLGFLLNVIGIDPNTTLYAALTEVRFHTSSLGGEKTLITPTRQLASVHVAYTRPILYLYLLAFLVLWILIGLFMGGAAMVLLGIVVAGVLAIAFALGKEIAMVFETTGGATFGFRYRRNVIENVEIDLHQAQAAMALIAQNIVANQGRVSVVAPARRPHHPAAATAPQPARQRHARKPGDRPPTP